MDGIDDDPFEDDDVETPDPVEDKPSDEVKDKKPSQKPRETDPEVEQLRQYRADSRILMAATGWDEETEGATRRVMLADGHSKAETEKWIAQMREQHTPEEEEPRKKGKKNMEGEGNEEMRRRIEGMEKDRANEMVASMDRDLKKGIDGVLNGKIETDLKKILDRIADSEEDEKVTKRRTAVLQKELRRAAVEVLKEKRDREGTFSASWVEDAILEGAERVASDYRAVIGNPNRIGRAPETVAGEDLFDVKKDLKAPEFQAGMGVPDVQESLKDWNKNQLMKAVAEMNTGKKSRA